MLVGWPLLPLADGSLHPVLPLNESPVLRSDADWPLELRTLLQKLACRCVAQIGMLL